jgi:hypothetical protein
MKTISRQALFEDAWTRPLSKIAPEFGVSDVGLRKICSRNNIPTPGRGYWAQVAAGRVFPRPSLASGRELITIVPTRPTSEPVRAAVERAKAIRAPRSKAPAAPAISTPADVPAAEPPAATGDVHKLVQRTQAKLASAKGDDLVHVRGKGLFAVAATPAQADRVGRLLTKLITVVEAIGWRVESAETGLRLVPDGEAFGFEIVEQTDRRAHAPTESEQAALRKHEEARERAARRGQWFSDWGAPKIPEWDSVPNGRLALILASNHYLPDRIRRRFSDGKHQRLEGMLDQVVQSLAALAAGIKAQRERHERAHLEALEAQKRREDLRRRQELEDKRVEFLKAQMKRLARAREIEDFVREIEAQGEAAGLLVAFLDWARQWAMELRAAISSESLRTRLEHFDLMNDEAVIGSWVKVD